MKSDGNPMVNVCAPLVPPLCDTVTLRVPIVAVLAITKLQVNDVALTTTVFVTVTPDPLTLTARFVWPPGTG